MSHHKLKCLDDFYQDVITGKKTFEVRKNDRDFAIGDTIDQQEITVGPNQFTGLDEFSYTGETMKMEITYMLKGGRWGIEEGYCVLGIKPFN
jgi:hypothetical protein